MKIERCLLHQLELPFRFRLTHASASRGASDSLLVELVSGSLHGYGEAVMRPYVGGLPPGSSLLAAGTDAVAQLLRTFRGAGWLEARLLFESLPVQSQLRPLFGALEGALIDLECQRSGSDLFTLLGQEPRRERLRYSAVLPMLPSDAARALLERIAANGVDNVRVKLGRDAKYNHSVLTLARSVLGSELLLRADVNQAWTGHTAGEHLEVCRDHGVTFVEDPTPYPDMPALRADRRSEGFVFVADEPFVTEADLERIAAGRLYGMLNIRLTKNGGLLRSLAMAAAAESRGLAYCLGCLVGETGILSSLGRSAAALMKQPAYIDGSYDSQLLVDNVTTANFDFGPGGWAAVTRGAGVGYAVDAGKVARYSTGSAEVPLLA